MNWCQCKLVFLHLPTPAFVPHRLLFDATHRQHTVYILVFYFGLFADAQVIDRSGVFPGNDEYAIVSQLEPSDSFHPRAFNLHRLFLRIDGNQDTRANLFNTSQ